MGKILGKKFFEERSTSVAKNLLGKCLIRKIGKKEIVIMITETEAYDGTKDKASHAHKGKTKRNYVMFGEASRLYVYFTYGMHWMLNIVTGSIGYPSAVLIRGGELAGGRKINGPARLTKFLKIDKRLNNKIANKKTGLWIEDRGMKINKKQIKKAPRIGVDYAGEWKDKPYRFIIK